MADFRANDLDDITDFIIFTLPYLHVEQGYMVGIPGISPDRPYYRLSPRYFTGDIVALPTLYKVETRFVYDVGQRRMERIVRAIEAKGQQDKTDG